MISEKGIFFASDYWSANVYRQASNGYGKKGDSDWQIIALSEGWANYREWLLCRNKLGYDVFSQEAYNWYLARRPQNYILGFPRCYAGMFDELQLLGCSYTNMERALASKTFGEYKNNLIKYQPSLSDSINEILNRYEAYNF